MCTGFNPRNMATKTQITWLHINDMHINTSASARRILEYGLKVKAATLNKDPRKTQKKYIYIFLFLLYSYSLINPHHACPPTMFGVKAPKYTKTYPNDVL